MFFETAGAFGGRAVAAIHWLRQPIGRGVDWGRIPNFLRLAISRDPGVVERAEDGRWGSLWARRQADEQLQAILSPWPVERPSHWVRSVHARVTEKEVERIRTSVARNRPFGNEKGQSEQAKRLELLYTLRGEGRPKATEAVAS